MTTLVHNQTPTSKAAARSMEGCAATLREQVYDYLMSQGLRGDSDEEIQEALSMNPSTERPRRGELQKAGRVMTLGEIRHTHSGRCAAVWVAVGVKS